MNENVKSIKASEHYVKYSYDVKLFFMLDIYIILFMLDIYIILFMLDIYI